MAPPSLQCLCVYGSGGWGGDANFIAEFSHRLLQESRWEWGYWITLRLPNASKLDVVSDCTSCSGCISWLQCTCREWVGSYWCCLPPWFSPHWHRSWLNVRHLLGPLWRSWQEKKSTKNKAFLQKLEVTYTSYHALLFLHHLWIYGWNSRSYNQKFNKL